MRAIFGLVVALTLMINPIVSAACPLVNVQVSGTNLAATNIYDLGADSTVQFDWTQSGASAAFSNAKVTIERYPSGTRADGWDYGTDSTGGCSSLGYKPQDTWAAFKTQLTAAGAIAYPILNFGSNAGSGCTVGGVASVGATACHNAQVFNGSVTTYCVLGNEQYYASSTKYAISGPNMGPPFDLNASPGSGTVYGGIYGTFHSAVAVTAAGAQLCVDGFPQQPDSSWDAPVRTAYGGNPDCADIHPYAQNAGTENDNWLLFSGPAAFTALVTTEQARCSCPVIVGEANSVSNTPGLQIMSVTNELYTGMAILEAELDQVKIMTWHTMYSDGCTTLGNLSNTLYGGQNYGDESMGSINDTTDCPGETAAVGTLFPTAYAIWMDSQFVHAGEHMVSVSSIDPLVKVYAATYSGGHTVALFNLSQNTIQNVGIAISGEASGSGGNIYQYTRPIYDQSWQSNIWASPTSATFGAWTGSIQVNLPPFSHTVLQVN